MCPHGAHLSEWKRALEVIQRARRMRTEWFGVKAENQFQHFEVVEASVRRLGCTTEERHPVEHQQREQTRLISSRGRMLCTAIVQGSVRVLRMLLCFLVFAGRHQTTAGTHWNKLEQIENQEDYLQ